jgi:hypothetical protein
MTIAMRQTWAGGGRRSAAVVGVRIGARALPRPDARLAALAGFGLLLLALGLLLAAGPAGAAPLGDWTAAGDLARLCLTAPAEAAGACVAALAPDRIPDTLAMPAAGGLAFEAFLPAAAGEMARQLSDFPGSVAPVPLPAAGWLLLAGLGALGLSRRRPLGAALRASARTDLGLRPLARREARGMPAALRLRAVPPGRALRAFAPGLASPRRPAGGAGTRYAATAERAPPAGAVLFVLDAPGLDTDLPGSTPASPRLHGPVPGPAARPFACLSASAGPVARTAANESGPPDRPLTARPSGARRPVPVGPAAPVSGGPVADAAAEAVLVRLYLVNGVPVMLSRKTLTRAAAAALVAALGLVAQPAAAITLIGTFSGNDPFGGRTNGLYGTFNGVQIASPALAKCDVTGGKTGVPLGCAWTNTGHPDLKDETYVSAFAVTFLSDKSGGWSFDATVPGLSLLPHYMVVKGGNGWMLFDLQGALSGTWSTLGLVNGGGQQPGLSHLSFYNTGRPEMPPVPLPAAAWLMLAGIGGLGLAAGRRKAA